MEIRYIYHSCFMVETDDAIVVFDYWKDPNGRLIEHLQKSGKQVYAIVSHFHEDHYNPEILQWGRGETEWAKKPRLLLSYDTVKKRHVDNELAYDIMRPEHCYEDEYIKATYFRSTDIGVSVAITFADGTNIFHAGDLNNWYFPEGENLKLTPYEMEGLYMSIVRDVQAVFPHFNAVMFPLDPRLEKEMLRGAMQWLNKIYVDNMYPMHIWDKYDIIADNLIQLQQLFPNTTFHCPMPLIQNT